MIPVRYIRLERLPLTPNGKVDRAALPEPGSLPDFSEAEPTPSRTPVEELIVQTWTNVLKTKRIGVHDNFFELGGDSLLTVRVLNSLQKVFKVRLAVRDLYEEPTAAGIAKILVTHEPKKGHIETIAELRVKIARMSKEEVGAALKAEKR